MGNGIQTPNDARRAGKTAGMDGTKECKSQKPPRKRGGFCVLDFKQANDFLAERNRGLYAL